MAEEEKTEKKETSLSKDAQKVLELVEKMSILELARLTKVMEDKFGVAPLSVSAVATPAAGGGKDTGEGEEKKSAYDIILQEVGDQKIAVIKAIRSINQDLGLKEAKDLVESAPKTVVEALPVEEAEKAKKTLEEAGAKVSLE